MIVQFCTVKPGFGASTMKQKIAHCTAQEQNKRKTTGRAFRKGMAIVLTLLLAMSLVPAIAFATEEGNQAEETPSGLTEQTEQLQQELTSNEAEIVVLEEETGEPEEPIITDTFEITFMVEGSEYAKITVASGEKCPAQTQPTVSGKRFTGWFYEDEDQHLIPFDFNQTVVNEDMTVTAYFEGETVMVRYMSSSNADAVVLYTDQVPIGGTPQKIQVDIPSELIEPGFSFTGAWMLNGVIYEFNSPLRSDIMLCPSLQKGYTVWFHTSGVPIEPQIVPTNETVADPGVPVRTGYEATGCWYTDEAMQNEFNFATPVTQNLNLYAGWTPRDDTPYEIHYFLERAGIPLNNNATGGLTDEQRANSANFIFIDKEEKTGTTDVEVTVAKDEVPSSIIHKIRIEMGSYVSSSEYRDFAHYSYSTKTSIKPDGSTVVEVYFERNIVDLIFNLGTSAGNTKSMTITKDGVSTTYYPGSLADQYTVKGKIGLSADYLDSPFSTNSSTVFEFADGYDLFGWGDHNVQYFTGALTWELTGYPGFILPNISTTNYDTNVTTFIYNINVISGSFGVYEDHQMLESLDQTSPVDEANGRYYFDGVYYDDTIEGSCRYWTTMERGSTAPAGYQIYWRNSGDQYFYNGYTVSSDSTEGQTSFEMASRYSRTFDPNCELYWFYNREAYDISFNTGGGTSINTITGIKHGYDISSLQPANPEKETNGVPDQFLGWYDEQGKLFSFDGATMPKNNIVLTARWLTEPVAVYFYDSVSGAQLSGYATELSTGTTVAAPFNENDPDELAAFKTLCGRSSTDEFLGWYQILSSGALNPFSFEQPITKDTRLYARWNPPYQYNTVTYDVNGGTGTKPVDSLRYAEGTAAVVADGSGLTREGSLFIGWQVQGGTNTYYQKGSTIRLYSNIVLVAQYAPKANTIHIAYYQNAYAGDSRQVTWTLAQNAGVNYPAAQNLGFAKQNATFLGWSTSPYALAANSAYDPGKNQRHATSLNLYAVWALSPAQYTVQHLVVDGESLSSLDGWPQTFTTSDGNQLTIGSSVSASALEQQGYRHVRTAVGVDPYDNDSTLTSAQVSHTLSSMSSNVHANTISFYYVKTDAPGTTTTSTVPPVEPPSPSISTPGGGTVPGAAEGSPILNIFGNDVPLFGITGGSWSLFNLICTVLMLLASVVTAVWTLLRKRNKDEEMQDEEDARLNEENPAFVSAAATQELQDSNDKQDSDEKVRIIRPLFLVLSAVASVLMLVLFIITQDITLPLVLFDLWSIVFGIGLVAGVVVSRLSFGKKSLDEKQDEEITAEVPAAAI